MTSKKLHFYTEIVESRKQINDFNWLPTYIYRDEPRWIQPLTKDIEFVFDKKKNSAFASGEIIRWNVYSDNNRIVGRLAAFTNRRYKNTGDKQATGGIGFFECIDNSSVAHLLFKTAQQWLSHRGMAAMDGPINFGERDKWWGLLIEGFQEPTYCLNYHLPYYKALFESFGFKPFYEQYCYGRKPFDKLPDEHWHYYNLWDKNPDVRAVHVKKNQLDKFAEDFTSIYNRAWASHGGSKTISSLRVKKMFAGMKMIMNPYLIWFVYYKEEPIAMWVSIPDINAYFKNLKGSWSLWARIKLLWLLFFVRPKRFVGMVFGIVPQWQGKGIDKYIMIAGSQKNTSFPKSLEELEIQWIGDFNVKMISVVKKIGSTPYRTLITYRYLFNQNQPFERHPLI